MSDVNRSFALEFTHKVDSSRRHRFRVVVRGDHEVRAYAQAADSIDEPTWARIRDGVMHAEGLTSAAPHSENFVIALAFRQLYKIRGGKTGLLRVTANGVEVFDLGHVEDS